MEHEQPSDTVAPRGTRRRQPVPARIGRILVPVEVLAATDAVMRQFGSERRECYVWWGGYFLSDGSARVVSAIVPRVVTHFGRVHLPRRVVAALHERLRALDLVLVTELHTHPPGAGGQNDVDAENAAATYPGFTSVIVPNFAFPSFNDLRTAYVYEYLAQNRWKELSPAEITARFNVRTGLLISGDKVLVEVSP